MTSINNPWNNMTGSSQRRVDLNTQYNLFWMTDMQGNYGFCIRAEKIVMVTENKINLKGITVLKRNSNRDYVELFLILNNKEDWQIFHVLCEDLISVTKLHDTEDRMINAVEIRLKRWQQLLKQNRDQEMTVEKQMGLFSELICLRDVVALKTGIKQAIISWVGPDFDKQDFLMDNAAIEVKSYRTSKGETIQVSSIQQLNSEKEPLFLISYALTSSENGLSIEDISRSIKELLISESNETLDIFENKLMEYGYIPEIFKEPLQKFILDKEKVYYVSDLFPKIRQNDIRHQITSVKYSIDLSQCREYEVELKTFLDGSDSYN